VSRGEGFVMTPARNNRPWTMLVMEFAGDTTLHGIRFLAQPTKFLLRRFNSLTVVMGYFAAKKEH